MAVAPGSSYTPDQSRANHLPGRFLSQEFTLDSLVIGCKLHSPVRFSPGMRFLSLGIG